MAVDPKKPQILQKLTIREVIMYVHNSLLLILTSLFLSFQSFFTLGSEDATESLDVIDIFAKSLEARKKISSIHVTIETRYREDNSPIATRKFEIIYEGNKRRFFSDMQAISEEYCTCFVTTPTLIARIRTGKGITLSDIGDGNRGNKSITIKSSPSLYIFNSQDQENESFGVTTFFPPFEYLGYKADTLMTLKYFQPNHFYEAIKLGFDSPNERWEIKKSNFESKEVIEIVNESLNNDNKRTRRWIIDPEKDMYPIFAELYDISSKDAEVVGSEKIIKLFEESIKVDIAQHRSGCWYPANWHYKRIEQGKTSIVEEGRVTLLSLNEPISNRLVRQLCFRVAMV